MSLEPGARAGAGSEEMKQHPNNDKETGLDCYDPWEGRAVFPGIAEKIS